MNKDYTKTEIYQIYYDMGQKKSLMKGDFINYLNENVTINFENDLIKNLIPQTNNDTEWVGLFSVKTKNKVKGFSYKKLAYYCEKYNTSDVDIISYNPQNWWWPRQRKPNSLRKSHVSIIRAFNNLIFHLIKQKIIPNKQYCVGKQNFIYSNFFMARREVYLDYINKLLIPAIELCEKHPKIRKQCNRPAGNYKVAPSFYKTTGLNFVPKNTFILERLINIYIEAFNINKIMKF
jgi:hypothetical protein